MLFVLLCIMYIILYYRCIIYYVCIMYTLCVYYVLYARELHESAMSSLFMSQRLGNNMPVRGYRTAVHGQSGRASMHP